MRRKVLITGGSGFIGTNAVQYYLNQGAGVLSFDFSEPRHSAHGPYFRQGDICDLSALQKVFAEFAPTELLHLAARTDLDETQDLDGYRANIKGVENIISCCRESPTLQRAIFASSMLVCRFGYQPTHDRDYQPSTLYGESKVLTEKIILEADLDCEWLFIRPTSIWGPWFGPPYRAFFEIVREGRFVDLGKHAGVATYGYIGNALHQIEALFQAPKEAVQGRVFYLGDEPPTQLSEWGKEIAELFGVKLLRIPFVFLRLGAWFGDFLRFFGISFPITSFRLGNMTTSNIVDLSATMEICPELPFSRKDGGKITVEWLKQQ